LQRFLVVAKKEKRRRGAALQTQLSTLFMIHEELTTGQGASRVRPDGNIGRIIRRVFFCCVLSSRPPDQISRFRSQRNHPYTVDSIRRGHASRDCHGWTEPKSVDLAAKSFSSQPGHRGSLCRLWVRVRSLDEPGYRDSQTS
jgi:hypothetical protein